MKRINYIFIWLAATILTTSCENNEITKEFEVESIQIQPDTLRLFVGEVAEKLNVTILPENALDKELIWSTQNDDIASVNSEGVVTAITKGKTNVIAVSQANSNISDKCVVIVEGESVELEEITLNKESLTLNIGYEEILTPTFSPKDATNTQVTWQSSDTDVATISNEGVVKAIAEGNVLITVTSKENPEIKATCKVTVNAENEPHSSTFTLEETPLSGENIEGDIWYITNSGKPTTAEFEKLRSAIKSANRAISLEFPNLEAFPALAFYIENNNPLYEPLENLTSIKAPEAVEIGAAAFFRAVSLVTIEIPKAKTINKEAFINCILLEEISLPEVTYIGVNAFDSCTSLTKADAPKATIVDNRAYDFCTSLTTVNLPKVTRVGEYAFDSCTELTAISLPSANEIGASAFRLCKLLTDVSLPEAVIFGTAVFDACYSLRNITLPKARDVGNMLFNYCELLQSVSMPKIETLGSQTFRQCLILTNVEIATESIVRKIAVGAFDESLPKNIELKTGANNNTAANGNYWVMLEDGTESHRFGPFNSISGADEFEVGCTFVLETIPADGTTISGDDWTITNSNDPSSEDFENLRQAILSAGRSINLSFPHIANIPNNALYIDNSTKLVNLASVTMSIAENIGSKAFNGCSELTSIDAPCIYNIGNNAFEFCYKLESVNIPKARNIGEGAFSFCPALSKMTISTESTVEDFDPKAFSGTLLSQIDLTTASDNGTAQQDNYWLMLKDGVEQHRFGPFNSITGADEVQQSNEYTLENIPEDGSTIIGNTWVITDDGYASDYRRLYKALYSAGRPIALEFPNLTGFVEEAFYIEYGDNFDNLSSVSAPNVTAIGAKAFYYCMNLTEIDFPLVAYIGDDAFGTCRYLTDVSLPEASEIGNRAFYSCYNLERISLPKATTLGEYTLGYMSKLEYILIATKSTITSFDIRTLTGNDLSVIDLVTSSDNGTEVDGLKWKIGDNTFGPFKSIEVE